LLFETGHAGPGHFSIAQPARTARGASLLGMERTRAGRREITVVGDFARPWKGDGEEIAAIVDGRWSPSTADFRMLAANSGEVDARIVSSPLALIHLILDQPLQSIRRLNIVSHGDDGGIGFSGDIEENGDVLFNVDDVLSIRSLFGLFRTHERDGFNRIVEVFIEHRGHRRTFVDVWNRFGLDAEIVVYACNVGVDRELIKAMAHVFQVTVRGFDDALDYFVPFVGGRVQRRDLRVAVHRGDRRTNTAATGGVADFHSLRPTVTALRSSVVVPPDAFR
jgi:hypothetical protein